MQSAIDPRAHHVKMPNDERPEAGGIQGMLSFKILKLLQSSSNVKEFLGTAVAEVVQLLGRTEGGLVSQQSGEWAVDAWTGERTRFPAGLVSEAIDLAAPKRCDDWLAVPLDPQQSSSLAANSPTAFVIRVAGNPTNALPIETSETIQAAVDLLATGLHRMQRDTQNVQRIEQLQAVLTEAAQWQRISEDEALLKQIAAAATKLLNCERASIFLWDRRRKKLIGRPALGVEGVPLEVNDHEGVVGEVLTSGEPKIWNANSQDEERRVNRAVDRSLAFQTRSLVAVPMLGHRGDPQREDKIGVFEAINHLDDGFDTLDVAVLTDLALHAAVAIESLKTRKSLTKSRDQLVATAASAAPLIGNHRSIESVRKNADRIAKTDLSVLVLGNNGTGKEVLARHIHYHSDRRHAPFVAVNCAALVESLLESELFGHERGSFTDASQTRIGKFELADSGTLFLDEVGDLSPGGQAKLLRVLEDKMVVRVGGSQPIPVDVRVIAATNQPLETHIAEKRFREDLFFRLNVVSLTLPPLASRGDDVLLLAEHFLSHFSQQIGRLPPKLDPQAQQVLRSHPWPGNIRELRNTMERICYLSPEETITADDIRQNGLSTSQNDAQGPSSLNDLSEAPAALCDATRIFQVGHIERAIAGCGGNMTEAAEYLGLHRSNLYRKMRQLGMSTTSD
ncbi:sigma-54-dependent Fis family transcriptional regulator [Novipirellula aureliae]|nr:sigma 54-interacting transcriptional regulator [Novipirellula aureliae]